jgi:hypothetical protein
MCYIMARGGAVWGGLIFRRVSGMAVLRRFDFPFPRMEFHRCICNITIMYKIILILIHNIDLVSTIEHTTHVLLDSDLPLVPEPVVE